MDPVSRFTSEYKPRFRALTEDFLARAVKAAKIDVRENAVLAKRIRQKERALERAKTGRGWRIFLLVLFLLVGAVATALLYIRNFPAGKTPFLVAYWILCLGLIAFKLIPDLCRLGRLIPELTAKRDALVSEALDKLLPFYRQFSWNTLTGLIERTLPELRFDDYLTRERMQHLREIFNFDFAGLMADRSMLFTHSGTLFGHPFLLYNTRVFVWGEETYTGTKRITWTTRERGPDGKLQTRFHSQTLFASVTKPCPRFFEEKHLLFAHSAAPNLSFTRKPADFSGKTGFFARMKRRAQLRKLKRFESILDDESNYTLVANQDFEVLFNTMDRDHEVEFRVLFTPRAQQQMVALLNDTAVGYGDDVTYIKRGPVTLLSPEHLTRLPFSTEPTVLPFYDFKEVLHFYFSRYEEFFRSLYFTLAPLLAIPAYQVPPAGDPADIAPSGISPWEFEAIANWRGAEVYAHPDSCTDNLYTVKEITPEADGSVTARLIATGFRGTECFDRVPVYGRDGRTHFVTVPWTHYTPVRRQSFITASAGDLPGATLTRRGLRIRDGQ